MFENRLPFVIWVYDGHRWMKKAGGKTRVLAEANAAVHRLKYKHVIISHTNGAQVPFWEFPGLPLPPGITRSFEAAASPY